MQRGGTLLGPEVTFTPTIEERFMPLPAVTKSKLVNVSVERRERVSVLPVVANVDNTEPINIAFNTGQNWADLASSYFSFRAALVVSNTVGAGIGVANAGTEPRAVATTRAVTLNVNPVHSLFQEVRVRINGQTVSDQAVPSLYPLASYIKTCLTEDGGRTKYSGWTTDMELIVLPSPDVSEEGSSTGVAADLVEAAAAAPGALHRKKPWIGTAVGDEDSFVQVAFKPREGFLQQPYFIPPGTQVDIQLLRTPATWPVIGNGTSTIDADPALAAAGSGLTPNLRIREGSFRYVYELVQPSEDAATALNDARLMTPLHYPMVYTRSTTVALPNGNSGHHPNILQGTIPNMLAVCFALTANIAQNRAPDLDPFAFRNITSDDPGSNFGLRVSANGRLFPAHGRQSTNAEAYAAYCHASQASADFGSTGGGRPFMSYSQWKATPIYVISLSEQGDSFWSSSTDDTRQGSLSVDWIAPFALNGYSMVLCAFQHAGIELDAAGTCRTIAF